MADFAHSIPASRVHPLTRSGAPRQAPFAFKAVATGPSWQAAAASPDAALIDFAGRVVRLAERDQRAWDRRAAIEDKADGTLPPRPEPEVVPKPVVNEDCRVDGSTGPIFDPPD